MASNWDNWTHSASTTSITPVVLPSGADANVTLALEPDSKDTIILQAIAGAKASIWLEMYSFTYLPIATALAKAASAGIDVQVLYEPNRPHDALLHLTLDQQQPSWAQPHKAVEASGKPVTLNHAKLLIIDGGIVGQEQALIMTTNLDEAALGGSWASTNREYIIRDTDHTDIQMLMGIFLADKQGTHLPPLIAPKLVVTDINAHALLRAMIDSAQQSVYIQTEAIKDPNAGSMRAQSLSIEGALINAAHRTLINDASRNLDVRLMLPPLPGASTMMLKIDNTAAITNLTQQQPIVQVKTDAHYYMHGKIIIVDQRYAFVGSENLTRESLGYNREVGILISNAAIVKTLYDTFMQDWNSTSVAQLQSSTVPGGG